MKPNFALGLTEDGVTLWHRDATGWLRVGAVALNSPDMEAQMRDMSRVASALAPEGVTTKLVIPDDQILYCDLAIAGRTPEEQEQELRAQLGGRTPYPVEELVLDWSLTSGKGDAQAVVVARETILEAEEFANLYGLNPVSAVAEAKNSKTTREPFFGATRSAQKIVPDIAQIERDHTPLVETGLVTLPDPEPVVKKPAPAPTKVPTEAAKTAPPDAKPTPATKEKTPPPTPEVKSPAPSDAVDVPKSDKAATPDKAAKPDDAPKTPAKTAAPPAGPKSGAERKAYASSQAATDRKSALLAKLSAAKPAILSQTKDSSDRKYGLGQLLGGKKADAATTPEPAADLPRPAADVAAFRSRRGDSAPEPTASAMPKPLGRNFSALVRGKTLGAKAAFAAALSGGAKKADAKTSAPAAQPETGAASSKAWVSPLASTGKPSQAKAKPEAKAAAKIPAAEKPKVQAARKGPLETLQERGEHKQSSEAERLTIFGARNNQDIQPAGKSRALLVLGGAGLVLVAAAIWAGYFFANQPGGLQLAQEPAQDIALEPEITAPEQPATALEDIEAALGLEDAAQQLPLDTTEGAIAPDSATAEVTEATPDTAVSAQDPQAGRIAGLRSVALLPPQEAAPLPSAPAAPAPFGSEPLAPLREEVEQAAAAADVAPDEMATPAEDASAALPAGEELLEIAVSDGTPSVVPPTRPEGLAPELEASAAPEAVPEPEAAAEQVPVDPTDESLLEILVTPGSPSVTPPTRPEGIAPEQQTPAEGATDAEPQPSQAGDLQELPRETPRDADTAAESDEAALSTPSAGALALTALRPAARPEALAIDLPDADETPSFSDASDLAVAASLRPGSRPSQFSAVVQRTLRAAETPRQEQQQQQQSEPIQTARAAVPDAPPIPTSASVSREATQARAINLRQINLLGVMGTSSERRALVRLSNGRVVTVRVGETLDGGQVTAIGDDELRYSRRGRNVVLRIAS